MTKPSQVYVTYIATTPEKLWRALVDERLTEQYWNHRNVSDWKPGSRWEHRRPGPDQRVDMSGQVIESTPPTRLVLTFAFPGDEDDRARHSRVTFQIEPQDKVVRLTVVHEDIPADMVQGFSSGWPKVLSSLKSLLETGHALPVWAPAKERR